MGGPFPRVLARLRILPALREFRRLAPVYCGYGRVHEKSRDAPDEVLQVQHRQFENALQHRLLAAGVAAVSTLHARDGYSLWIDST